MSDAVVRHSTRIRGFHARAVEEPRGMSEETVAYRAEIWRGEERVGYARNEGRGGQDRVHVDPAHRKAWEALVEEAGAVLSPIEPDGSRAEPSEPYTDLVRVLREAAKAEKRLLDPRTEGTHGFLAHQWEGSPYDDRLWPTLYTVFYDGPPPPVDAWPDTWGAGVRLGADNDGFLRPEPPRNDRGGSGR